MMFPFKIIFGGKLSAGLPEIQTRQALICRLARQQNNSRGHA